MAASEENVSLTVGENVSFTIVESAPTAVAAVVAYVETDCAVCAE